MTDEQTTEVVAYDDKPLMERMDASDEKLTKLTAAVELGNAKPEPVPDLSWSDAFELTREDPAKAQELFRAFDLNLVAENPGLFVGGGITRIIEPVMQKRRTINAIGLGGMSPKGMNITYAQFIEASTGYNALVTKQDAEGDELSTGKFGWDDVVVPISTYGGGTSASYQLLLRSDPAYQARLLTRLAGEWAYASNAAFVAAVVAGGTDDTLVLGADTSALTAKLIDLSVAVEDLTDSPANVVLMASDVWTATAKLPEMINPAYPVQNADGTVNAGGLSMQLSGLTLKREPALPDGIMLTTRGGGEVAEFAEEFHGIASDDDIRTLSKGYAIWGFGANLIYIPAGLFVTTVTLA